MGWLGKGEARASTALAHRRGVGYLLPPSTIAGAIEEAFNGHLAANDLRLDTVELTDGVMTLVVSDA